MNTFAHRHGLSLLELMIITVVFGILALVTLPKVEAYRRDARVVAFEAEAESLAVAMERYHEAHGTYVGVDTTAARAGAGLELAFAWLKPDGVMIRAESPDVPGRTCHVTVGAVPLRLRAAAGAMTDRVACLSS